MANRTVRLYKKVKTGSGWRRYPVVIGANGRIKSDTVVIGGEEYRIPGGRYELRHFEGSKTVWTPLRGGATEALAAWKTAQAKANAKAEAEAAGVAVIPDDKRTSLQDARDRYIAAALARGAEESAEVYGRAIDDFLAVSGKRYADEIEHADVVRWLAAMRKAGKSDRTISNRHGHLRSYLMYLGIDRNRVREITGPKPRYDEPLPEIFSPAELRKLFASLSEDYDKLLFDVLLSCGLREQEVMHLEWTDIDARQRTLKIQSKPRWQFEVKDDEEREVPLQASLLKRLQAYRKQHPGGTLIFGRRGGQIDEPGRPSATATEGPGEECRSELWAVWGMREAEALRAMVPAQVQGDLYHHATAQWPRSAHGDEALRSQRHGVCGALHPARRG